MKGWLVVLGAVLIFAFVIGSLIPYCQGGIDYVTSTLSNGSETVNGFIETPMCDYPNPSFIVPLFVVLAIGIFSLVYAIKRK